ncbi:unnamed protein product, partial [Choristocarpus tenellus]
GVNGNKYEEDVRSPVLTHAGATTIMGKKLRGVSGLSGSAQSLEAQSMGASGKDKAEGDGSQGHGSGIQNTSAEEEEYTGNFQVPPGSSPSAHQEVDSHPQLQGMGQHRRMPFETASSQPSVPQSQPMPPAAVVVAPWDSDAEGDPTTQTLRLPVDFEGDGLDQSGWEGLLAVPIEPDGGEADESGLTEAEVSSALGLSSLGSPTGGIRAAHRASRVAPLSLMVGRSALNSREGQGT